MSKQTESLLATKPTTICARVYLKALFREYWNDYLSVDRFAAEHQVDRVTMWALIDAGRRCHDQDASEEKAS